jgi:catechol 2,3-dioxygenase
MLNTETIFHPKLQHFGLLTGNMQRLLEWYQKVLGMWTIHQSENPTDAPAGSPPSRLKAAFISNDEISHRVAVIEVLGLTADPERSKHRRLQHVGFEFGTLDELLGTYARLKALGIVPQFSVDEGPPTGFYYEDPMATASRSMSATIRSAGRRSNTCKPRRISTVDRSESTSIPTR